MENKMMNGKKFILSKNIDRSLVKYREIMKNLDANINNYLVVALQDTPACIETDRSRNWSDKYAITHYEYGRNSTQTRLLTAVNQGMASIIQTHKIGNTAAAGILSEISLKEGPPAGNIYVANIYIRPQAGYCDTMTLFNQLMDKSKGKASKVLIIGDVNASSILWDPGHDLRSEAYQKGPKYHQTKIQRGLTISEYVRRHGMHVLKQAHGSLAPTYKSDIREKGSYINICIIGEKLYRIWTTIWAVPDIRTEVWPTTDRDLKKLSRNGSPQGHLGLMVTNKQDGRRFPNKVRRVDFLKTELMVKEHFIPLNIDTRPIRENWRRDSRVNLIKKLEKLTDLTVTAIEIAQNKARIWKNTNKNSKEDIHNLVQRLQKLKRIQGIQARRTYRKSTIIKITKNRDLGRRNRIINRTRNKLVRRLQRRIRSKPSELWTRVNRLKKPKNADVEHDTEYSQEQVNLLVEKLFPDIDRNIEENIEKAYKPILITQQELHTAKELVKKKKYTGPDDITFKAFNRALELIPDIIYDIARISFYICHIPEHCQITQGTVISKKQPGKYRIVHVSTALTAFLEVIALNTFQHVLEMGGHYNHNQFGFKSGRGRTELVNRLITSIATHRLKIHKNMKGSDINRNNQTTLVALDISGAFDNVRQREIIGTLMDKMPQEGITYWIKEFIMHRKIAIKYKGWTSYYRQVLTGVPQGSALEPLLWNLAIEDIDRQIYHGQNGKAQTEILAYADDLTIISHGCQQRITQDMINRVNAYLESEGLELNAQKSEMMVVTGPEDDAVLRIYPTSNSMTAR